MADDSRSQGGGRPVPLGLAGGTGSARASQVQDVVVLPHDDQSAGTRPVLLVDIDGVLNIFGGWIPIRGGWSDSWGRLHRRMIAPPHLRQAEAAGYTLLLNPQHRAQFAELEKRFDIIWATMWMENAWMFGQSAGFGVDWPFIDFDAHREIAERSNLRIGAGVGSYKHPGIVATLADRPGVWVDDDMSDQQLQWARRRTEAGIPTLFIRPDPADGMTDAQVAQISQFADALCPIGA